MRRDIGLRVCESRTRAGCTLVCYYLIMRLKEERRRCGGVGSVFVCMWLFVFFLCFWDIKPLGPWWRTAYASVRFGLISLCVSKVRADRKKTPDPDTDLHHRRRVIVVGIVVVIIIARMCFVCVSARASTLLLCGVLCLGCVCCWWFCCMQRMCTWFEISHSLSAGVF